MSRRHLAFVVVAIASLVVSACGTAPTAPSAAAPIVTSTINHDDITTPPPVDSTGFSGWSGSH